MSLFIRILQAFNSNSYLFFQNTFFRKRPVAGATGENMGSEPQIDAKLEGFSNLQIDAKKAEKMEKTKFSS